MREGHRDFGTRLLAFGSFRFQAGAVRQAADPGRRTVLVTPEGIASEIRTLFHFALACARRLPSHTFILRCHPQVPMAEALRLVSEDVTRQPNIILSDGRRIDEDFARASALLYRGSSSVMYAILQGVLPVLMRTDGPDHDPVYGLETWRRRCATPEELASVLAEDEARAPADRQKEWEDAARYVRAYTGPVGDAEIDLLLSAVGLGE
jgi:hypothetical protein